MVHNSWLTDRQTAILIVIAQIRIYKAFGDTSRKLSRILYYLSSDSLTNEGRRAEIQAESSDNPHSERTDYREFPKIFFVPRFSILREMVCKWEQLSRPISHQKIYHMI
ncbi:Helix-loop-helix [Dirofilaria immitis]